MENISENLKVCHQIVSRAFESRLTEADRDLLISISNYAATAAQAFDHERLVSEEVIEEELRLLEREQELRELAEVDQHERLMRDMNTLCLHI